MELLLSDDIRISPIRDTDRGAYLEHLKAREIADQTLRIPYPYTEMDVDEWMRIVRSQREERGADVVFAIRNREQYLIGGIGYDDVIPGRSFKAEIGYWLAKPYWGRGIMTLAVKGMVDFAFNEWKLTRISAAVMAFNTGSCRVLEKCGFQVEGIAPKYYCKNQEMIDAKLYSLVR